MVLKNKTNKVKSLNMASNCVKFDMISLGYDIVVIGALVIKFLFGIQNDGRSFYNMINLKMLF